jgi:hypothetical protein
MPNLLEDPTPVIVVGIVSELVLGAILWHTGRGRLLWLMAGVAALTLLGVVIERLVVTPREQVAMTLEDARRAVVANDLPATLRFLTTSAREERDLATMVLRRWKFSAAAIHDLEISLEPENAPQRAKVRLVAVAAFEDRRGEFSHERYPARVEIQLERSGDRWLITRLHAEQFHP